MTAKPPKIDKLIRSKRKTLAFTITSDGSFIVRAPQKMLKRDILRMVKEKADWIAKKQAEMLALAAKNPVKQYQEGELFWFLGEQYPLKIVERGRTALRHGADGFYMAKKVQPNALQVFKNWYRLQAAELLPVRTALFSKLTGLKYKKVRITSAKTRLGSYSTSGTISYPWRLIMAPPEMIDYVIVHELVHSKHQNHSKAYWSAVEKIMPDYKERRKWFKTHGHELFLDE